VRKTECCCAEGRDLRKATRLGSGKKNRLVKETHCGGLVPWGCWLLQHCRPKGDGRAKQHVYKPPYYERGRFKKNTAKNLRGKGAKAGVKAREAKFQDTEYFLGRRLSHRGEGHER